MKILFDKILMLLTGALLCLSCRQLPQESVTKTDSIVITRENVPVLLKGGKAQRELNLDSLMKLYAAGQTNRYYTVTDKNGTASLEQRIDLLTGQIYAQCTARDSIYNLLKETREHYSKETKTVALAAEKPTYLQQFKTWFNTNLLLVVIVLVAVNLLGKMLPRPFT